MNIPIPFKNSLLMMSCAVFIGTCFYFGTAHAQSSEDPEYLAYEKAFAKYRQTFRYAEEVDYKYHSIDELPEHIHTREGRMSRRYPDPLPSSTSPTSQQAFLIMSLFLLAGITCYGVKVLRLS